MEIHIREAKPEDFDRLEEILIENDMLSYPEIDGRDAMQRIYERMRKYFLVAETQKEVVGIIRGVYDGSRAMIHQIAVDPEYQRKGVGKRLIKELAERFREDKASTISVTVTEKSINYFRHLGFFNIPITLMLSPDINCIIHNAENS